MTTHSSLLAGVAWLALAASLLCGAQQLPVPVTLHVTAPKGVVLRNAKIGIAAGAGEPFSFYRSDGKGNVTISLAPGEHDLRVDVRGYPMTYAHVEVAEAATVTVVLGHGTASKPAQAVAGAPSAMATKKATQSVSGTPAGIEATPGTKPPGEASPGTDRLQAYTSCYFPDALQVVSVDPLDAGVDSRAVDTADGKQQIDLVAGERVMFAYPFTDFFANVKAEELPADHYAADKATLLANLAYLESQPGGPTEVHSLPGHLHGFEVHGNNRQKLEGGVLGMYLLFDDPAQVATTIYFLNQESWRRKFQTMDQYRQLRDQFLTTYTGCVRENQAIAKPKPKRR